MPRPALRSGTLRLACTLLALGALSGCSSLGLFLSPELSISSSLKAKSDGFPVSLAQVAGASFPSNVQIGERVYSLFYWSQGQRVQGYLDVPPGKGPFPLLVDLHGGWIFSQPLPFGQSSAHSNLVPWSEADAENFAWSSFIVFFPNYAGYGPSYGPIGNVHSNYVDVINGLTALGHLRGLHIKFRATYLLGTSMGGAVAMMVAGHDEQVRAVALDSPYPGDIQFMKWLLQSKSTLNATDSGYLGSFLYRPGYGTDLSSAKYRENSFPYQLADIPILIIGGNNDPILPPSLMQTMYQHLKQYDSNVQLQFFPGGHAPSSPSIDNTVMDWLYSQGL